jgi:hypothetical protein
MKQPKLKFGSYSLKMLQLESSEDDIDIADYMTEEEWNKKKPAEQNNWLLEKAEEYLFSEPEYEFNHIKPKK